MLQLRKFDRHLYYVHKRCMHNPVALVTYCMRGSWLVQLHTICRPGEPTSHVARSLEDARRWLAYMCCDTVLTTEETNHEKRNDSARTLKRNRAASRAQARLHC